MLDWGFETTFFGLSMTNLMQYFACALEPLLNLSYEVYVKGHMPLIINVLVSFIRSKKNKVLQAILGLSRFPCSCIYLAVFAPTPRDNPMLLTMVN